MNVSLDTVWELTWVPVIVFAICLGYGVVLLYTKDPKVLIGKGKNVMVKNRQKYAIESGKLLLFMAAGSAMMCILLFVNVVFAVGQICLWCVLFGIMWKRVYDAYGPV